MRGRATAEAVAPQSTVMRTVVPSDCEKTKLEFYVVTAFSLVSFNCKNDSSAS